jgi:hypothetical protein
MKSKIFLLALPFAALSILLAFCSKEQVNPNLTNVEKQSNIVTERGGPCQITITATRPARICGVIGTVTCTACTSTPIGATQGANFGPNNPHTIQGITTSAGNGSITNLSSQPNQLLVSINGIPVQQALLPPGGCREFQFVDYNDQTGTCDFLIY